MPRFRTSIDSVVLACNEWTNGGGHSALLENGADPNTSGMFGEESYLHAAERLNDPEIAALLRKHGAKQ